MKYLAGTGSQYTESFAFEAWSFHELATSTDTRGEGSGQTAVTTTYDDANRITGVTQGTNAVGFSYAEIVRR